MVLGYGSASIVLSVSNLVSVAEGRRSSNVTLGFSYAVSALTAAGGAWLLAESATRDDPEVGYVGGAGIALGVVSLAATVWAHTQPVAPRSARWTPTPIVALGARGERVLGAGITLRAW